MRNPPALPGERKSFTYAVIILGVSLYKHWSVFYGGLLVIFGPEKSWRWQYVKAHGMLLKDRSFRL